MLSVLIPVYNFDCYELVSELSKQCTHQKIPFEIICLDDASEEKFRQLNSRLSNIPGCWYQELAQNTGRSKIRNLLASKATYPNLLFMDCDSKVIKQDYIAAYIPFLNKDILVYGGRCYENTFPSKDHYLRWLYGIKRESIAAEIRKRQPHLFFLTNNFLIPKNHFQLIRFNEELSGYGHEDTLFGLELQRLNLHVEHIDNPLCHIGLETDETFLAKTVQGLRNLNHVYRQHPEAENRIKLLRVYKRLNTFGLTGLFRFVFGIVRGRILVNLRSKSPSLFYFDLFKLDAFIRLREAK